MDFPRLQITLLAGVVLVVALFLKGPVQIVVPILMLCTCGYQIWRILPYTPLVRAEIGLADNGPDAVRVLSVNVLMENQQHQRLLEVIRNYDPDILFLMETDKIWVEALEPVLVNYTTVIREPMDNHYGLVFATRLPCRDGQVIRLTSSNTPSIFAELMAPNETAFRFVGLHPRPPVPGESTKERDAQIYYAARFALSSEFPLVTMGDFNDVAWSDTSRTFKRVGQYLDPRIGRGFFASFDAKRVYFRFPIDQLYVTADVAVVSIERGAFIGSDHFPMSATLRFDSGLAARLNAKPESISSQKRKTIEDSVEETRAALGHRKF